MKNKKEKFTQNGWKIVNNTDSVDIDQSCIGMNIDRETYPSDVRDYIKTNRGLHLQIRHNKDKQTYEQAVEVSHLIAASPCLFDKLSVALERLKEKSDGSNRDLGLIQSIESTLNKALGGQSCT